MEIITCIGIKKIKTMRTKTILPILLCLLLASCKGENKPVIEPTSPLEEVDTTYMKRSFLREIRNYVTEHDSCNVFIIWPEYSFQTKQNDEDEQYENRDNEVFRIDVAFRNSFADGGEFRIVDCYPHRYIKIGEKYVFIHSRDDNLYDQEKLKSVFDKIDYKGGYSEDLTTKVLVAYNKIDSCESLTLQYRNDSSQNFRPIYRSSIKFTAPVKK